MTYAYFDAAAGLSGDMILGALLDLGVDPDLFRRSLAGLKLPVTIDVREVRRGGLRALKADVAVHRRRPLERRFADVERVIGRGRLDDSVKDRAIAVFRRLFEAEARVHGRAFEEVHLHEAGADDALVDVVGACVLLAELGIERIACSPLNVGSGWVETAHGALPVPPPAVAELLTGVPVYAARAEVELVTPTGAAIVATLADEFLRLPELVYRKIGWGAGGRDLPGLPNVLRVFMGEAPPFDPSRRVYVLEADVDDATPQVLARFLDIAIEKGALDATLTPVVMKKNRLGTRLTILAEAHTMDGLAEAVFRETSSIGLRCHPVERRVLERRREETDIAGTTVGLKVSSLGGEDVTVQPEYEDALRAARASGLPLKEILRRAAAARPGGGPRRPQS